MSDDGFSGSALEHRIERFHSRIQPFVTLEESGPVSPNADRERVRYDFDRRTHRDGEMPDDVVYLLEYVTRVADLSEHIKRELTFAGLEEQLYTDLIAKHSELAAIMDLDSARRFGTPLRKPLWDADIRLENVGRSEIVKATPGKAPDMDDIRSVIRGNIVGGRGLHSVRNAVEVASWRIDGFLETHFPDRFPEVRARMDMRRERHAWYKTMAARQGRVESILAKGTWIASPARMIPGGALVRIRPRNAGDNFRMGYVTRTDTSADTGVLSVLDILSGQHVGYADDGGLDVFHSRSQAEFKYMSKYHWDLIHSPYK